VATTAAPPVGAVAADTALGSAAAASSARAVVADGGPQDIGHFWALNILAKSAGFAVAAAASMVRPVVVAAGIALNFATVALSAKTLVADGGSRSTGHLLAAALLAKHSGLAVAVGSSILVVVFDDNVAVGFAAAVAATITAAPHS